MQTEGPVESQQQEKKSMGIRIDQERQSYHEPGTELSVCLHHKMESLKSLRSIIIPVSQMMKLTIKIVSSISIVPVEWDKKFKNLEFLTLHSKLNCSVCFLNHFRTSNDEKLIAV